MINFGFIIDSLNGGGAERVVLNLANKLVDQGHVVHIFILKNEIDYNFDKDKLSLHIISNSGKVHSIKFFNKRRLAKLLLKKIKEQNISFDLFVSNLEASDEVSKIAKLNNLYHCINGVISEFIENKYKNTSGIKHFRRKFKYYLKTKSQYDNTKLIASSQGVADDLIRFGIKPKSLTVIHNGFNFDEIRNNASKEAIEEDDYIICVGRFAEGKCHELLIEAYKKSKIKEKLIFLGTTDKPSDEKNLLKIKKMINDLRLNSKITFKGFVPNPYPWIKKAKALILSSKHEALPTVLIESLILQTQTVSTNCPVGPSEILVDNLSRFLSPVGDADALASNIKHAIENPLVITDKHIEKFNVDVIAKKYVQLAIQN